MLGDWGISFGDSACKYIKEISMVDLKKLPVENMEANAATGQELLGDDELRSLRGELKHGEAGYVPLDDQGKPTGRAMPNRPEDGEQVVAPVYVPALHPSEELVTPSGAPITSKMNPDHSFRDPALAERLESNYRDSPAHKRETERAKQVQEQHSRPNQNPPIEPEHVHTKSGQPGSKPAA
jgi:hypothetical protein